MTLFLLLVVISLLLLAIGMPVAYVLGATAAIILVGRGDITLDLIGAQILQGVNSFVLLAIPFFVLAGNLMNQGGITQRLIRLANQMVGWSPGGLAQVAVGTNIIMAGMSGSDVADVQATGSILIPALKKQGYPAGYAAGVIAGAGSMGPLIPPSVAMVVYSLVADTSVVKLFVAGIVPGLMVGLFLMVMNYIVARRNDYPTEPWSGWSALGTSLWAALPGIVMPVIVVGGIMSGFFTPTEGAAIAVIYGLLIGLFVYRELKWKDLFGIFIESMKTSAGILIIVANASLFGAVMSFYNVGQELTEWFASLSSSPVVLLMILNIAFLITGMMIDSVAAMILLMPLLLGTLDAFGIDRTHFGIIVVFNLCIGLMLPPHGLAMLIVMKIAEIDMMTYLRESWPVVVTMFLALIAVTYLPEVTLWLPTFLGTR